MIDVYQIRERINDISGHFGLGIDKAEKIASWSNLFKQMRRHAIVPRTVFDIGVATGTPWLYREFPNASFHLFDPTRESLPYMQDIARGIGAQVFNVALGSEKGEATIKVRSDIGCSTLYDEVGEVDKVAEYTVPVERLDHLVREFATPALCKIDVQGAEIEVLNGMDAIFDQIDIYIIECTLIASLKGGPEVFDVMKLMHERGYELFDVVSLSRRPLDQALAQMDLVFTPRDHPLRRDKRWKA